MNVRRGAVAILLALFAIASVFAKDKPKSVTLDVGTLSGQPRLSVAGIQIGDSSGNGDGWIQPGETVDVKVKVFNEGTALATSVFGTLDYLGISADVTIVTKTASWPDIPSHGSSVSTSHFVVQLSSAISCGTTFPFRAELTTGTGELFDLDFTVRVGQRVDYDTLNDGLFRNNRPESILGGADPNDFFSTSSDWGDINGDGYADLVLGVPNGDSLANGRPDAGEVYLVYGGPGRMSNIDWSLPPSGTARFWGATAGDGLGVSVATGDFNGDGFDDILAGAVLGDGSADARADSGEAYVIYGKSTQWTDSDLGIASIFTPRLWGADAGDHFGIKVASGDVNGDGVSDVIVGANLAASLLNGRAIAGEVYLIYGGVNRFPDTDLIAPPPGVARFWGPSNGNRVPTSLTTGDFNGDGFSEIAIGTFFGDSFNNSRPNAGEVHVVYGSSFSWPDTDLASPPPGISHVWGAVSSDLLAQSGMATGDINGDGYKDLIVGAPAAVGAPDNRSFSGTAYLIYGNQFTWPDIDLLHPQGVATRFWGPDSNDVLGFSIASGDLNGDGYDDVVMGARDADSLGNARVNAGEVYVLNGKFPRWADLDLVNHSSEVSRIWGNDPNDTLYIPSSGDMNGDGMDDLFVGAPGAASFNNARPRAGEGYILYGRPRETYYARSDTFSFVDATSGTNLGLTCDDCSVSLPIGFNFPFYGQEFPTLYISSNGVLSFFPIQDLASANPICPPSRNPVNQIVAALWDDLNPEVGPVGSGVFALLQGTAPARRLTIEWKDIPHYPAVGAVTFEVTLFEATGAIVVQYQDLDFGSPSFNNGLSAVVGVENRIGGNGLAYSCKVSNLLSNGSAIRMIPNDTLFEDRSERGAGLITTTGFWHLSASQCEPNQHTGTTGWYFGQDASCTYPNGVSGSLRIPTMPAFPADARLAFHSREQIQVGVDTAKVQLSTTGTGGVYGDILNVTDNANQWVYAGVTNLFANPGNTVDLRFQFNSDLAANGLGWMVDDIQLVGCNAVGAPSVAMAVAYGQLGSQTLSSLTSMTEESSLIGGGTPLTYCEGSTGRTDAIGSYCGDSGIPASFQWKEDGAVIPGATSPSYSISASKPPGSYSYTVGISCPGGAEAESAPVVTTIVARPGNVGETLTVRTVGGQLHFDWIDAPSAASYTVFQDSARNGAFSSQTGSASSGATGLTVPMPPGTMVYFLVAGENSVCGLGPKN